MNKYHIEQTSKTLGTVVIAGILVNTFLPDAWNNEPSSSIPYYSASNNYAIVARGTSPTYESDQNILRGHYSSSTEPAFETVVASFFEELSSNQEALGHEFERVLFENLWDLYQS